MKCSLVAALGAALIAAPGGNSAAQAGILDFGVTAIGGPLTYTGSDLENSRALDFDDATLLVVNIGSGDDSGLSLFDTVSVFAPSPPDTDIKYGSGTGSSPLTPEVVLSWTGSHGAFTETLNTVEAIARNPSIPDSISVTLTGTVTAGPGFIGTPVTLILSANQAGGPGDAVSASFTDMSARSIPETSTWAMMALGFGALGYAASRRRKTLCA